MRLYELCRPRQALEWKYGISATPFTETNHYAPTNA
jgi:hypothetical protein